MSRAFSRIYALFLRNIYLLRSSPPRAVELIFWAALEVAIWGFMSLYLKNNLGGESSQTLSASQLVLAGALLWVALSRSGTGFIITFMEEIWSRNFGHLFVSPLRPWEFVTSLMLISALRMLVGFMFALAFAVLVFDSHILTLGLSLALYMLGLIMMSWIFGLLIVSTIFRFGMSAEWLGWMVLFAVSPISCIYYPLAAMPGWIQPLALAMPATHLFEGMRAQFSTGIIAWEQLGIGFALNFAYFLLVSVLLGKALTYARANAMLVQQGE